LLACGAVCLSGAAAPAGAAKVPDPGACREGQNEWTRPGCRPGRAERVEHERKWGSSKCSMILIDFDKKVFLKLVPFQSRNSSMSYVESHWTNVNLIPKATLSRWLKTDLRNS
jgi:hypothetical protein